jgi:hypothetical protein
VATKAGVGMSRHHNPNLAGREAAEQALEKAGINRRALLGTLSRASLRLKRARIRHPSKGAERDGFIHPRA